MCNLRECTETNGRGVYWEWEGIINKGHNKPLRKLCEYITETEIEAYSDSDFFLLFALFKNPSLIILQSIIKVLTNIAICVVFLHFVILHIFFPSLYIYIPCFYISNPVVCFLNFTVVYPLILHYFD